MTRIESWAKAIILEALLYGPSSETTWGDVVDRQTQEGQHD